MVGFKFLCFGSAGLLRGEWESRRLQPHQDQTQGGDHDVPVQLLRGEGLQDRSVAGPQDKLSVSARRGAIKIYFHFCSPKNLHFSDYNELILDEHEECGCQCSPYAK